MNRIVAKRPVLLSCVLALLVIIAVAYQVRTAEYRFPGWFHHANAIMWPFRMFPQPATGTFTISFLHPNAKEASLREGDTLLEINGQPADAAAVFGDAIRAAKPGDLLQVKVRRTTSSGEPFEHMASVRLQAGSANDSGVFNVLLFVVMPVFCILLGFWVVAVRIRDPRAWLLLGLMLGFEAFFDPGLDFWPPWARDLGTVYRPGLLNAWPIWLMLLGIYFPQPFPAESGWRVLSRWKWALIVPVAIAGLADVVVDVGAMEHYPSIGFLARPLTRCAPVVALVVYGMVGSFVVAIIAKSRLEISPDARRRLQLLWAGAVLAFTPFFILVIISRAKGVSSELYFPAWLVVTSYVLVFLFPVTLAYVIVVHRAMEVRVVIRQGLQYAVAKTGISVLRVAIGVALYFEVVSLLNKIGPRRSFYYAMIVAGVVLFIAIRRILEQVRKWIDRRFFREAYNTEQILQELSDKVRTIVETQPLLATVSEKIAESLHVPHVAVLIDGGGPYRPAYAFGYGSVPQVSFPEDAATARYLLQEKEPALVYFDDRDSWIYRSPDITEEERRNLQALQAELLLPLSVKDKLLGFISLSTKRSEEPYSGTDLRLLQSVAAQTGLALENARLTTAIAEEIAQREKLNREVEIAREVQERLFPQELPPVLGLDYFGKCRPAFGVGGDYYDFVALPDGKLGIAVGDVSGKGIAAALMMASLQASLRGQAMLGSDDLAALMARVNQMVFDASAANRYATFFFTTYDPQTRRLDYVNAGHNAPMVFRQSSESWAVSRLEPTGMVVGLLRQSSYQQASFALQPGDRVVAFTDGISEAMNPRDEEWGEERLMEAVNTCDEVSASEMICRLMAAADGFAAGAQQHDDMTLVVLKVTV
jgi:phosphoserine phosphatase RsbU/P